MMDATYIAQTTMEEMIHFSKNNSLPRETPYSFHLPDDDFNIDVDFDDKFVVQVDIEDTPGVTGLVNVIVYVRNEGRLEAQMETILNWNGDE
ncbi:MAG: hypothetical protein LRY73_03850 [Bacillus sp. (in: Bacteria)]|nr:hypothetical protein [Bacillus sp. (in: firmicutes)]